MDPELNPPPRHRLQLEMKPISGDRQWIDALKQLSCPSIKSLSYSELSSVVDHEARESRFSIRPVQKPGKDSDWQIHAMGVAAISVLLVIPMAPTMGTKILYAGAGIAVSLVLVAGAKLLANVLTARSLGQLEEQWKRPAFSADANPEE